MAVQTKQMMSVADYLAWEAQQEVKHEYIDGEIIAMTGGTANHSKIKVNFMLAFGAILDRSEYQIFNSDMQIRVDIGRYVYPDLSIVRGAERFEDEKELVLLNPTLVIEVTSPSSESYDRGDKLSYYVDVPSIEAYLIIDHQRPRADLYTRAEDGWLLRFFSQPEDVIPLGALSCELPLAEIYRGIAFAEA